MARDGSLANGSASCPATVRSLRGVVSWDEHTSCVTRGISVALVTVINVHADGGYSRSVFDELGRQPLCDPALHIPSFCLTDSFRYADSLCICAIHTFLEEMTKRLKLRWQELVLAYMIIECIIRTDRRIIQKRTVRLAFLTAISIVMKLTIDCEWFTSNTFDLIADMVLGCNDKDIAQMEWRMLMCLNYTFPVARKSVGETCIVYTVELMRAGGTVMSREDAESLLQAEEEVV